jgi:hypothetical protein
VGFAPWDELGLVLHVDGDPNLWCRCTATSPAAVGAVLSEIWALDREATRYYESVELRALDRPSAHGVNWSIRVRIVPALPAFELHLSGTWAELSVGGQTEFSIVFLP